MKLGIGFNIFSGGELLKPACLNARQFSDCIVVMFSPVSDSGTVAPKFIKPLLDELLKEKLIDKIIECNLGVVTNCINVQNLNRARFELGRQYCLEQGCTHFMGRDCDEFYLSEQFKQVLQEAEDYDVLIVRILDYINNPLLRAKSPSPLHVPLLHKISNHYIPKHFPVLIDLARTVNAETFKIFSDKEILMHHFTGVRFNKKELIRKFEGHSHFIRLGEAGVEEYLERVLYPDMKTYEVISNDIFGVKSYWENEFKLFYERYMNEASI